MFDSCLSWHAEVIDGHNIEDLCKAFHRAANLKDKPFCILAKTFKGKGIPGIEDQDNWHGKPLGNRSEGAMESIGHLITSSGHHGIKPRLPSENIPELDFGKIKLAEPPSYKKGEKVHYN